jgi:hypothetical protein
MFTAALICCMFVSASCKKFVDLTTPPNAVGNDLAFSDSSTATGVVLGIYAGIANNPGNNGNNMMVWGLFTFNAMSADEGYYLTSTTYDAIKNNQLAAGNQFVSYWSGLYKRIGFCNSTVEGLSASTLPAPTRNQLMGEAKFMRAWFYFSLVNFFGDVPLVLNSDAISNSLLPRSPVGDVYAQIEKDLTEAKGLLNTTYPTSDRARANKSVASALLAKVYFYQGKWAQAESEATSVISNTSYSLTTNLANVFLNNSNETIWQVSLVNTTTPQTILGSDWLPSGTTPNLVFYDTLANTFEANDQRKVNWTKSISYLSKNYLYPFKYKVKTTTTGNEFPIVFRLGELYLTRGEARAQQNNLNGAQQDINAVRNRAGLGNTTATTKAQLLTAFEHERWVELFTEGDRWFNLKRLDRAKVILPSIKPAWKDFQQLYPLPQQDLNASSNLKNNPGY